MPNLPVPHRFLVALLSLLLLVAIAACSDDAEEAEDSGDDEATEDAGSDDVEAVEVEDAIGLVGVSVADQRSLFYVAEVDGMRVAAEESGVELLITSANNDSVAQINQVQDLLTQNIEVLLFTSQDDTAATSGVQAANEAGVPVIAVDQRPESEDADLATFIATDSVAAARELCTWMFDEMGGSGQLAIIQGVLGSTAQIQRSQGCDEALEEYPDIEVVAIDAANWDETEAFNATENILTANPDLDAVFGQSDAMALGAAKAAEQAGRHDDMWFVGIDGFPTMFEGLEDGLVHATMAQQPFLMGQLAIADAITLMEGGEIPELQYQDAVLVTQENVDEYDAEFFYGPMALN